MVRLFDRLYPIPAYLKEYPDVKTIFVTEIVESLGYGLIPNMEKSISLWK